MERPAELQKPSDMSENHAASTADGVKHDIFDAGCRVPSSSTDQMSSRHRSRFEMGHIHLGASSERRRNQDSRQSRLQF